MQESTDNRYQALLLLSFGGPEGPDDVLPFLENVTRGRNIPRSRLLDVAHHYQLFGGVSPINQQNRDLIAALRRELRNHGTELPIYWGNRNWHPFLTETVAQMRRDGIERALAFVTAAYSSYSCCRQYLEDITRAREAVGPGAPRIDKIRPFYNHPGFVQANVDYVREALEHFPAEEKHNVRILFTAHSIPQPMARACAYEAELLDTCALVAGALEHPAWELVYQSRSGPPSQPWLEPDVEDALRQLRQADVRHVIIAPVGFISDHMEVIYDLDTQAGALCRELGIQMIRARTAGTHPAFIAGVRELIEERMAADPVRRALGSRGPAPDTCPAGCCLPG